MENQRNTKMLLYQKPRSSSTKTTWISVCRGHSSRMTVTLQIRSGEWQSAHLPVVAQGVFLFRRRQFLGADLRLMRLMASSMEPLTILFRPMTKRTFLGPKIEAATRLPLPSMFTRRPSAVRAFALSRKRSAVSWRRMISIFSEGESEGSPWRRMVFPAAARSSRTPRALMVSEPPKPTEEASAASWRTTAAALAVVRQRWGVKPRFWRAEATSEREI